MRFSKRFGTKSRYLRATDLVGDIPAVIARVAEEEVGRDKELKPILYFKDMKPGLVLTRPTATA